MATQTQKFFDNLTKALKACEQRGAGWVAKPWPWHNGNWYVQNIGVQS